MSELSTTGVEKMNELKINNEQTMSSLEIAELVESRHDRVKKLQKAGYIYLISSPCGTKTKIGRSIQPKQRARSVITISGGGSHEFTSCVVKDAAAVEYALHKAFSKLRTEGEWFDVQAHSIKKIIDEVCKQFSASNNVFETERKQKLDRAELMFEKMNLHFGGGI